MSEDLRRLFNALQRAVDDLANARVLVDNALRQVEDQVQEFQLRKRPQRPSPGRAGSSAASVRHEIGPPRIDPSGAVASDSARRVPPNATGKAREFPSMVFGKSGRWTGNVWHSYPASVTTADADRACRLVCRSRLTRAIAP